MKPSSVRLLSALASSAALFILTIPVLSQGVGQPGGPGVAQVRGRAAVEREVLVKLNRPVNAGEMGQLELQADADRNEGLNAAGIRRVRSRRFDVETLISFFQSLPFVEYAEPNYIVTTSATPNDPQFPSLWGLFNATVPGADISAKPAWDVSTGSTSQVVGIIDTGIDYNHPDLASNTWSAPTEFTVTFGVPPNQTTYTCAAGTHGFNAITNACDPMDDHNHGTHVAGTIGAIGNNNAGVAGVNWTASLMGLKFLGASGSGSTGDAIKAIDFATQVKQKFGASANARILSNSWGGGGFSQALLDAINRADTNDMLFVAAAGNSNVNTDTTPHYPSSYTAPNVVSVASTTNTDGRSSFSNYGATSVDLGAPGSGIVSTVRNGGYASFSGTSMATPHVSGAAALVLSVCAMNTAALKTLILDTVDPISALAGITVTGGRLNVNAAITGFSSCDTTPPAPVAPAAPTNLTAMGGNAQVALAWSASSGASSYAVKRRTLGTPTFVTVAPSVTATSFTNTGLTNGTTYEYVVIASNGLESGPSNIASATPQLPPAPPAPAGLTARANGKGKIDLAWGASSGATSYLVKRSQTSGSGYATIVTVTSRTYSDRSVQSGVTYYYVVTAANAGGQSGISNQASAKAR